jgi:putative ABC transport system ATP-binding protein
MLKINNIYKTFNPDSVNEVRALRGVSVDIEEGDFVCVLGTNGSGKSTMLNAVAGTFLVDQGEILLNKHNLTRMPEHKRAKYIGRVFQNPFSGTAPDMTIAENIALAAKRGMKRGLSRSLSPSKMDEFIAPVENLKMGLEDRLENPIGKLSGGQRQALTLLMASWRKPELLLLDEHTAALDPKTAAKVIELTKSIVERDNLTTLMVTHSMQQAVNLGNRILMLHKGKVAYDIKGSDKKHIRVNDLLALFDDIRRKELIDESVAELIQREYV